MSFLSWLDCPAHTASGISVSACFCLCQARLKSYPPFKAACDIPIHTFKSVKQTPTTRTKKYFAHTYPLLRSLHLAIQGVISYLGYFFFSLSKMLLISLSCCVVCNL